MTTEWPSNSFTSGRMDGSSSSYTSSIQANMFANPLAHSSLPGGDVETMQSQQSSGYSNGVQQFQQQVDIFVP